MTPPFFLEMNNLDFTSEILHANLKGKVRHGSIHIAINHSGSPAVDNARELAPVF